MTESDLVQSILITFGSRPDLRIWRANVLVAKTKTGRVVKAGVKGQADISGLMLPHGKRIEIETKFSTGQSKEQKRWQAMIERFGGLYILARSTDDVARALNLS